jgi:hypothetical protein
LTFQFLPKRALAGAAALGSYWLTENPIQDFSKYLSLQDRTQAFVLGPND